MCSTFSNSVLHYPEHSRYAGLTSHTALCHIGGENMLVSRDRLFPERHMTVFYHGLKLNQGYNNFRRGSYQS